MLENFRRIGTERTENDEIERKIFDQSKNKVEHLGNRTKTIQLVLC